MFNMPFRCTRRNWWRYNESENKAHNWSVSGHRILLLEVLAVFGVRRIYLTKTLVWLIKRMCTINYLKCCSRFHSLFSRPPCVLDWIKEYNLISPIWRLGTRSLTNHSNGVFLSEWFCSKWPTTLYQRLAFLFIKTSATIVRNLLNMRRMCEKPKTQLFVSQTRLLLSVCFSNAAVCSDNKLHSEEMSKFA